MPATLQKLHTLHTLMRISSGILDVIEYASDGDKTDMKHLVSGINCIPESATEQMMMTKQRYGKIGGTVAFHAYQSFRYKEASPELAHQIGVETAKKLWGGRFEVVVSTHLNTDSIHNHFVINSVSFVDGKRLNDNKVSHRKFREVSIKPGSFRMQNILSMLKKTYYLILLTF